MKLQNLILVAALFPLAAPLLNVRRFHFPKFARRIKVRNRVRYLWRDDRHRPV